jgi:hypothetical protein
MPDVLNQKKKCYNRFVKKLKEGYMTNQTEDKSDSKGQKIPLDRFFILQLQ